MRRRLRRRVGSSSIKGLTNSSCAVKSAAPVATSEDGVRLDMRVGSRDTTSVSRSLHSERGCISDDGGKGSSMGVSKSLEQANRQ